MTIGGTSLICLALFLGLCDGSLTAQVSPKPGLWDVITRTHEEASAALTARLKAKGKQLGGPTFTRKVVCIDKARWDKEESALITVPHGCTSSFTRAGEKARSVRFTCNAEGFVVSVESTLTESSETEVALAVTSKTTYIGGLGDHIYHSVTKSSFISPDCSAMTKPARK